MGASYVFDPGGVFIVAILIESISVDGLYTYLCPVRYAQLYSDLDLSRRRYLSFLDEGDACQVVGTFVYRPHPEGYHHPVVYYRYRGVLYWMDVSDFERFVLVYRVDLDRVYDYLLVEHYVFPDLTTLYMPRLSTLWTLEMIIGQLRYIGCIDTFYHHPYAKTHIYAYRAVEGYYFLSESGLRECLR